MAESNITAPSSSVAEIPQRRTFRRLFWHALVRNQTSLWGLAVITVIVASILLAPVLPLKDPDTVTLSKRLVSWFSSMEHPLGTDELGRDLLSRLVWGGRVSLTAGIVAALMSMVPGVLIGLVAAYRGGKVDMVAMRFIDILLAFPPFLLAVTVVAALGPSLRNGLIALGIAGIPVYARVIRGIVLSVKEHPFVEAARAVGATDTRILFRHILPNTLAPLIVLFTLDVGQKILYTAGLSFLGLGTQPPTADWGSMLSDARPYIATAPHFMTIPGVAIFIVVLALNLIGDGLRDALDPRVARR